MSRARAASLLALALGAGCSSAEAERQPKEPLGRMPEVVTTAEPEWIPFRPRAGQRIVGDPRETKLDELRRVTDGGGAARVEWLAGDRGLVVELVDGGGCARLATVDLGTGEARDLERPAGRSDRLVGVLASGRVLALSGPCGGGPAEASLEVRGVGRAAPLSPPRAAHDAALGFLGTELWIAAHGPKHPRRLVLVDADDGAARESPVLASVEVERAPALSRDGARVAWVQGDRLWTADARGGSPRALTEVVDGLDAPTFLPDGRVAFAAPPGGPSRDVAERAWRTDVWVVDPAAPVAAGGHPPARRLTEVEGFDGAPRWSRTGEHVAWVSARGGGREAARNVFVATVAP